MAKTANPLKRDLPNTVAISDEEDDGRRNEVYTTRPINTLRDHTWIIQRQSLSIRLQVSSGNGTLHPVQ
jgi:hypothetical protein